MSNFDFSKRKLILSSMFFVTSNLFAKKEMSFNLEEFLKGERTLLLTRHNKTYSIPYFTENGYDRQAYLDLCEISKDTSADIAVEMDVNVFNIMFFTDKWFRKEGNKNPVILTSGYRSKKTNDSTEGASRNSLHLLGKGVDYSKSGISQYHLAYCSRYFGAGGVGIYTSHTHIDTGNERAWIV